MRPIYSWSLMAQFAVLLALVGCGSSPTSPGIQPEIVNAADHFSYQVSSIQGYSGTDSYSWQNAGAQATINQSCSFAAGAAILIVLDDSGTQVYEHSLSENGTFTTAAGVPGAWTIRILYDNTNATVNFRADRTT